MLTVLVNLMGVAVIVIILRAFTRDMPALRPQLQIDLGMLKAPGTLKEKMDAALQQEQARLQGDPQAARLQAKAVAVAVLTLGLALGLVGLASLLITQGMMYDFQVTLLLLGLGLLIWGSVNFVRSKKS